MKYDRLRLTTNPPAKTPPEGFADLYIDPDTGALMKKTAAGSATQVGTTGGSLGAITVTTVNLAGISSGPSQVSLTAVGGRILNLNLGAATVTLALTGAIDTDAGGSLTTGTGNLTGPAVSGMIPAVPSYADETAANAALSSGDFYWNVALGKLKTATA